MGWFSDAWKNVKEVSSYNAWSIKNACSEENKKVSFPKESKNK